MKPGILRLAVELALLASCGVSPARSADDLKAFPPAEPGMVRHVVSVPRQGDETALRVELVIGKTVTTDASNRYFFSGRLDVETIRGWGYQRYVLRNLGPMAGTLMAVDPDAPRVERFIGLGGEPKLLRYNSRLPYVIYVPEGVEVRYRIWRADPDTTAARPE